MSTLQTGLALACLATLSGCANPLLPLGSDFDRKVPLDRLRSVQTADFDSYVLPPEEVDAPTGEDAADEILSPYRGLERVPLSLEECRVLALRNNLDLQVALIDPTIANQSISEAEARFDSTFTLNAQMARIDNPTFSALQDGQQQFDTLTPGLSIPLRTGGQVDLSLPITRNETDNQFATFPESFTTDARLSLTQSLLRNAGRRVNTAAIAIAGYNQQISESQTKLSIIAILARVDRAYWRLYQAIHELDVRVQEYDVAKAQLERARRQFRAGTVAEVEVVRSESGLADRLEAIIVAQNSILLVERELKELLNTSGLEVDTETIISPVSEPDPVEYGFDQDVLVRQALDERMELLEVELRLLSDALDIETAENGLLPLLDFTASYTFNGLGETPGESFRELGENEFTDWSVGVNAQVPLGKQIPARRAAKVAPNRHARGEAALHRARGARRDRQHRIRVATRGRGAAIGDPQRAHAPGRGATIRRGGVHEHGRAGRGGSSGELAVRRVAGDRELPDLAGGPGRGDGDAAGRESRALDARRVPGPGSDAGRERGLAGPGLVE